MTNKWKERPILHPDHAHELEREAAINEFKDKLPKEKAEEKAHADYKKKHHLKGAAHHLRGINAAIAAGDLKSAKLHGLAYELHCKQLGKEPWKEPDDELNEALNDKNEPVHSFKAHKSDEFILQDFKSKKASGS